jgi:PKD repeat protein
MLTLNLNFKNWLKVIIPVLAIFVIVGCGDDDVDPPPSMTDAPISSFQFAIDENDFLTVNFTNFSQNATTYAWDFGDSSTSTEESPSHTYAAGGDYTVTLTASNADGESATREETITITNPNSALTALTGTNGKTWKLYREGTSMSVGPNADDPAGFWPGLTNDGTRPCLYTQEFTFNPDGSFVFDDMGGFWAEFGVFSNVAGCNMDTAESCFEATAANMINACGDDVSAWLSGTHTFEFNPSTGQLTLNGMGAWIGIPKLGTTGEFITPQNTVTTNVTITENDGFDLMLVEFIYDGVYWPIRYASYSDASLEPELVTDAEPPAPFGVDLPDASPMSLSNDLSGAMGTIDTIVSASTIQFGVADPAGSSDLVGQFNRTEANFQELQFQTSPEKFDIDWANITTVSVDVYFPSSNDYSGALTKNVIVGLADFSNTQQWFTDQQEYHDFADHPEDTWLTFTFPLNAPSFVANPGNGATPYDRNDYDMMYIQLGSGNHTAPGTFFVRNFVFE